MRKSYAIGISALIGIGILMLGVMTYSSVRDYSQQSLEKSTAQNKKDISGKTNPPSPQETSSGSQSGASQSPGESNSDTTDRHYCTAQSRAGENCDNSDTPVCGWYDQTVVCTSGPCIRSTFPNECEACTSKNILYWTNGDCPLHE